MDNGMYNVIYLDERAAEERTWTLDSATQISADAMRSAGDSTQDLDHPAKEVDANIRSLLSVFSHVHVCRTGSSCLFRMSGTARSHGGSTHCTFVLVHIPHDDGPPKRALSAPRSPSPTTKVFPEPLTASATDDLYGMPFLLHLSSEKNLKNISPLVLPIAILGKAEQQNSESGFERHEHQIIDQPVIWKGDVLSMRYHEAGAVDVLVSPMSRDRVHGLPSHAYRTMNEFKAKSTPYAPRHTKKSSWMGVTETTETQPFAYLREEMVSNLMDSICHPDREEPEISPYDLQVSPDRKDAIAKMLGRWEFSAHDWDEDELLYGASLMLKHALSMPDLKKWQLPNDSILRFLLACRRVYNSFVLYHNFRHACDVLQATFHFLQRLSVLPPYPNSDVDESASASPLAKLLGPFQCLTLLVSAIGHDVGHPGVNNLFLVRLNAPLAQLYNDRSVLESFHCAAYSQILRRHWPSAFADVDMRRLMINSILATDMSVHADYMGKMAKLQDKYDNNGKSVEGFSNQNMNDERELLCCLLIKCADICNVARPFNVSTQWAIKLTDEFANQASMEQELKMPTCLFGGPPTRDDAEKLGRAQIGFMNIFATPLFESISRLLPAVSYTIDEIGKNRVIWQDKIDEAVRKKTGPPLLSDPFSSPETRKAQLEKSIPPKSKSQPAVLNPHQMAEISNSTPLLNRSPPPAPHSSTTTATSNINNALRKSSAGTASHFTSIPLAFSTPGGPRRSSLGPTTLPSSIDTKASSAAASTRRGSAGGLYSLDGAGDATGPLQTKPPIPSPLRRGRSGENVAGSEGRVATIIRRSELACRLKKRLSFSSWGKKGKDGASAGAGTGVGISGHASGTGGGDGIAPVGDVQRGLTASSAESSSSAAVAGQRVASGSGSGVGLNTQSTLSTQSTGDSD